MKLLIFDIDGTLTDTKQVDDWCYIETFEAIFKKSLEGLKWEDIQDVTDWGILEHLFLKHFDRVPTFDEFATMKTAFLKKMNFENRKNKDQFSEVPGANKFFDSFREKSEFGLGIATGAWEESALLKLNSIDLNPTEIPFSNSSYFKKREDITMDAIKQAKEKYRCPGAEIIYFGDGVWDFKTCRNLGIRFIRIDILNNGKLANLGAENVFHDFLDFEKIIEIL